MSSTRPARPEGSAGQRSILHVGSGYRPLRWGGLVAYIEDLSAEQARRGDRVAYFFSGRYLRHVREPRLVRWQRDGVEMVELVSSPLHDHGRQPVLELSEPRVERLFGELLDHFSPDVVHFQELAGLPFSLLEIAKRRDFPVVLTLQDYFPLCSSFKLLDADGRICLRRDIGSDCRASLAADSRRSSVMYESSARRALGDAAPLRLLPRRPREKLLNILTRPGLSAPRSARASALAPADAFQRRREKNLELMNGVDRVVAMSDRVAEIYEELGVRRDQLTTMRLTLAHIDGLTPRRRGPGHPLTFATLGGGESPAKGTGVLLDALRRLGRELGPGRLRLLVFGRCERNFEAAIKHMPDVERRPAYRPAELDELLEEVDVGIMPSIWEEAYGYAGVEFIAKGIPVVSNPLGGMRDYVIPGRTGWLNDSASGRALAATMSALVARPEEVAEVARRTREARGELVSSIADHAAEVDELYRQVEMDSGPRAGTSA